MRLIAVALLMAALGCSNKIEVTSDTAWQGTIYDGADARPVEGSGNRTFDDVDCGRFQKRTEDGYLKVKAVRGGVFSQDEEDVTTAEYGVVTLCGK